MYCCCQTCDLRQEIQLNEGKYDCAFEQFLLIREREMKTRLRFDRSLRSRQPNFMWSINLEIVTLVGIQNMLSHYMRNQLKQLDKLTRQLRSLTVEQMDHN